MDNGRQNESDSPRYTDQTLGPYRVGVLIGKGSFGDVYRAVDLRTGRVVALKMLLNLPRTEGSQGQVNRETLLPMIQHPLVLQPLEGAGRSKEGVVYFATRLIEAGNLRDHLDRRKYSWKQAARMVHSLADTLVEVHKHLLHQDLKPENILLDKKGTPYIIDLGLALLQKQRHAQRNNVAGTWRYMAPEVFKRFHPKYFAQELEPNDARADIYSVGLILYELLTGSYAFGDGQEDFAARLATIDSLPQSPDVERPDIPIGLAKVCMQCLAPDPVHRISSATELRAALVPFVKWQAVWKPVAAAVVVVAVITSVVLTTQQKFPIVQPATPSSQPGANPGGPVTSPVRWITLTVVLADTQTRPIAGARVEVLSPYFNARGLRLPPPETSNDMGEARFTLQVQPADVQFSASHANYCPSRWNVPLGTANEVIRHQLKTARMVAVLDNSGSEILIAKTSNGQAESENGFGYAPQGAEVALAGVSGRSSPLFLPKTVKVEVLSGPLRGEEGYVSSGMLKDVGSRCP